MKQLYFFIFFVLFISFGNCQTIKSVQLYPSGNEIGLPITTLKGKPLVLEFDYLGENAPYFNYKIQHFDENWMPSTINSLDYIKGFNTGSIDDFEFSFDTEQLYTHYKFSFPNNRLQFKLSGNYKIIVYETDVTQPVLEERFYVSEQAVSVMGGVQNAISQTELDSHHAIEFSVNIQTINSINPREEFQANVMQNSRPDNELIDLKPSTYTDERVVFVNPFQQTFEAGNEYRWFNTKSTRYLGESMADILEKDDGTHVYLVPDLIRKQEKFSMYNDFNGQFQIEHQEGRNPDLEGDYVFVHFTLKETDALKGKDIYVYGELTNYEIKDEYKLTFNPKLGFLEATLYLKQGNYDYMYVTKQTDGSFSMTPTEGSFYRTNNQYTVFIYYKPFGANYTRLIATQQFNSRF